jgi:hypothetical protein
VLEAESPEGAPLYARLGTLVAKHHEDLVHARIVLAWHKGWRSDADGIRKLGMCKIATDLDRELAPFDIVILISRPWWQDEFTQDAQRDALLDHELTHAVLALDAYGDPVVDETGRRMYRIRRHDVEEFGEIVARHGLWKRDLDRFSQAIARAPRLPLGEAPRLVPETDIPTPNGNGDTPPAGEAPAAAELEASPTSPDPGPPTPEPARILPKRRRQNDKKPDRPVSQGPRGIQ